MAASCSYGSPRMIPIKLQSTSTIMRTSISVSRIAAVTLLSLGCVAARAQDGLPAGKIRQIEAIVRAEMDRQKIPGMSVAVVVDKKLVWSGGFGMADLENSVPAKAATVYRLGSISKSITAVAA